MRTSRLQRTAHLSMQRRWVSQSAHRRSAGPVRPVANVRERGARQDQTTQPNSNWEITNDYTSYTLTLQLESPSIRALAFSLQNAPLLRCSRASSMAVGEDAAASTSKPRYVNVATYSS